MYVKTKPIEVKRGRDVEVTTSGILSVVLEVIKAPEETGLCVSPFTFCIMRYELLSYPLFLYVVLVLCVHVSDFVSSRRKGKDLISR